jgi:thiamine-monophosphate kinase
MPLDEFAFIAQLLRPLTGRTPGAFDFTDDAAVIDAPGPDLQLVLTKDAMVAGVHFLPDDPADSIAQKLMRVNLSDLAAMGADPLGCLLALARPKDITDDWLALFVSGLAADQDRFGCRLLGGDTVSTPGPLTLSLTALGTIPRGQSLRRSGGRAGDDVWISGTLGDGRLGLAVRRGEIEIAADAAERLVERYRRPQPRVALGVALRGVASACLDVSDGLLADLDHLCRASSVGAEVEVETLPLSADAAGLSGARDAALGGGDDYELVFSAAGQRRADVERAAIGARTAVTRIGRLVPGAAIRLTDAAGREVAPPGAGWRHF